MRWTLSKSYKTRKVRRFALIPVRIDNEVRLFEMYYAEQSYNGVYWYNTRFITKEEYLDNGKADDQTNDSQVRGELTD